VIEVIPGLPDNVLGISVTGQVTGDDYEEVIIPWIEQRRQIYNKMRILYYCGPDFKGFKADAMWEDSRVGLKHWGRWEKIAVVTDLDWMAETVKIFGFMMPGEVRTFYADQLEPATAWVME
jgi:hypothetical protein